MAETEKVKTNRERYMERLKSKYPDREYADDEAIYGQINDDYDGYDKEINDYREREKEFADLFSRDPRSASFLSKWRQGADPAVELVRIFGDDFVEELKNPEKQEELAKASQEYAANIAKAKEYDELYKKNLDETLATIETVRQEEGKSDDDIDAAMGFLAGVVRDGICGKFSRESIMMAFAALNHDSDTAAAAAEGEIRGRNAKIDEKLRKGSKTDGTADLAGKNTSGIRKPRNMSMFDLADQAR